MRRFIALFIALCLSVTTASADLFSNIGAFANQVWEEAATWVGQAAQDTGDWVSRTAQDTKEWVSEAAQDVSGWVSQAAQDTGEWVFQAAQDTGGWVSRTARNTGEWIEQKYFRVKMNVSGKIQVLKVLFENIKSPEDLYKAIDILYNVLSGSRQGTMGKIMAMAGKKLLEKDNIAAGIISIIISFLFE